MLLENIYKKQLKKLDDERKGYKQSQEIVLQSEVLDGEAKFLCFSSIQGLIDKLDEKENEVIAKLEKLRGI